MWPRNGTAYFLSTDMTKLSQTPFSHRQGGGDGVKQVGTSAGLGFAKEGFDPAPHHLDGIEVRGVGRKEAHLGTDLLD